MFRFSDFLLHSLRHSLLLLLCFPFAFKAAGVELPAGPALMTATHIYGLPGAKAGETGNLRLSGSDLVFTGKSATLTVPLRSVIAVSAGNERVELWGAKGMILRSIIPDGGGSVAAAFMHHRVDMLTVEFTGSDGAYHCAVFGVSEKDVASILETVHVVPGAERGSASERCALSSVAPGTVRVSAPTWDSEVLPAAYRALVYERLIERLSKQKGITRVERDGAPFANGCPQYTLHIALSGFKQGSQVTRSAVGPLGMFVATTHMEVHMKAVDADGVVQFEEPFKATVRGQSESITVASAAAKKLTRQFAKCQKKGLAKAEMHASMR